MTHAWVLKSQPSGFGLRPCAREDLKGSKKRSCHVIFRAGSVVPPAARPKQTRRNDDLQVQSNAKTACAKRNTRSRSHHISISAGSLHLDRLAPPRWQCRANGRRCRLLLVEHVVHQECMPDVRLSTNGHETHVEKKLRRRVRYPSKIRKPI